MHGQSTLTGPTALQTEEIEENFEQKVAKEAKTDRELAPASSFGRVIPGA